MNLQSTVMMSGHPYDVTGCTFIFTGKYNFDDADPGVFQKKSNGPDPAITVSIPSNGVVAIKLSPEDTGVTVGVNIYCDLQMVTPTGDVYTVDSLTLSASPGVTTSTS